MDRYESGRRRKVTKVIGVPLMIFLTLCINLGNAKPINVTADDQSSDSSMSSFTKQLGSGERMKRQLFREEIPHHRPLSGNLYARHHGYPHPGRWHANQQEIIRPNYQSGLHFDNPNVILNDHDFNRYGSTLQHIDDHRIATNPAPILHEYPSEFGKVVNLGGGGSSQSISHSSHQSHNPIPLIATHHHIHNQGPSNFGQQYDTVEHGHAVLHAVGGSSYEGDKYQSTKSKPFFAMKFPSIFSYKTFSVPPILKSLWAAGRYGGGAFKRKGALSWSSMEHH